MVNLVKEAQESKKKIILSAMVAGLTIIGAFPLIILSGMLMMESWLRILLITIGLVVIVGGIAIACILDREAGAFECPHCGAHKYCKKCLQSEIGISVVELFILKKKK